MRSLTLSFVLLFYWPASGAYAVESDDYYQAEPGGFEIAVQNPLLLDFPELDKQLPLRIAYPVTAGSYPVIVFSHGGGSSKDHYSLLADHWAAHGYVVILPTHQDSRSLGFSIRQAPGEEVLQITNTRRLDMRHILDSFDEIETSVPGLNGKMDPQRLVAAGHSMGGATALAVTGLVLIDKHSGNVSSFSEDRFDALLLIGDPGNRSFNPPGPWRAVAVPAFIATGTNDRGANFGPTSFQFSFADDIEFPDTPNHYLFIENMDHYLGGLICCAVEGGQPDYESVQIIAGTSTAFLDRYVKDDETASTLIAPGTINRLTGGRATMELR